MHAGAAYLQQTQDTRFGAPTKQLHTCRPSQPLTVQLNLCAHEEQTAPATRRRHLLSDKETKRRVIVYNATLA